MGLCTSPLTTWGSLSDSTKSLTTLRLTLTSHGASCRTVIYGLWEQMHSVIVSKGVHAIKASWTKGHITEQQVNEGRYTRAAKVGNDLVDTMADVGAEGFGMAVQEVARAWAHRQGAYAKLERRILRRLANVMKADATKREELAKTQALFHKDQPQSLQQAAEELPYACRDAATTLDLAAMHAG